MRERDAKGQRLKNDRPGAGRVAFVARCSDILTQMQSYSEHCVDQRLAMPDLNCSDLTRLQRIVRIQTDLPTFLSQYLGIWLVT